ncbi:MAG: tetraacyldisaccharide 4'-kinase [Desulfarculaceae bacterium]|nr:tetraacyldisaccharide 4'-kinase [Desulfarculaceae bacterium]MCF8046664.1 tetraacyldisaccharide 4'-kinase [Desulfarculaceae bacterium]MCF8065844.1 tetraacyldisaccharide 4'-kinase [Desulfarculaceae bacterium]MCF8096834.1 tetraacyldisaccharide 4'-kinase [Desulfarculaceae bacterium]MCF8121856.1 tetraacyldisaccharide 4'-kinase [Desulfarculaceae bacterium]
MPKRAEALWRKILGDEPGPRWLGALRVAATAASGLYGTGVWLNNTAFDLGFKPSRCLPVPVIGVGNLAVGGTGKTPLTMAVVRALREMGLPAGVISRGYGRQGKEPLLVSDGEKIFADADQAGDEPLLLARRLGVPVAVGASRFQAGQLLLKRCGTRILVGDDLLQHRALYRDMNLVALDASDPLAGERLLPRGRLREGPGALDRAQAVVLTRVRDRLQAKQARESLAWRMGDKPVLACRYHLEGLELAREGDALEAGTWQGEPVYAFCGLARPESFRHSLRQAGLTVLGLESFGDHHRFTAGELAGLWARAQTLSARALICSGKDAVRLPTDLAKDIPVWSTRLGLEFLDGPQALPHLLSHALADWEGVR